MKNLFSFLFILIFACSCSTSTDDTSSSTTDSSSETTEPSNTNGQEKDGETTDNSDNEQFREFNMESLYGSYVGMFNAEVYDSGKEPSWANKINISVDEINGSNIKGHSVVAGNDRPFEGTITSNGMNFDVKASEPGDDKYDGVFTFTIYPKTGIVNGLWDANDSKLAVTQRKYELEKMDFKYDPELDLQDWAYTDLYGTYNDATGESEYLTEDVANFNPSTQELTKKDVENMKKGDLEVLRNSIYAKHGYSFKNRKMRYVFNYVEWYIPTSTDIRDQLTELEKKNIDLMKRYEQHADRYYDSFGR